MPLAIQPITPAVAALAADLGVALQPGALVNATVLRVLDANLVRIAIGRLTLDATTMKPLQQGQRLQLLVGQTGDAVTLTPVVREGGARSAAPSNMLVALDDIPLAPRLAAGETADNSVAMNKAPETGAPKPAALPDETLSPQETRAVAAAAQTAVARHAGLSQLFANLGAALDAGDLPSPVAAAAAQFLGLRQTTESISADDIRVGLKSSGLLFEPARAQPTLVPASPVDAPPDLKSTLLVLKQVLSTWIADREVAAPAQAPGAVRPSATPSIEPAARPPKTPGDAPAPPARAQMSPQFRADVTDAVGVLVGQGKAAATPEAAAKNLLAMQLIASAFEGAATHPDHAPHDALPPPFRNGAPTPQPVALPSLPADAPPAEIARQLLSETEGALARQTLLQVASLPDRIDQQTLRSDPAHPRWNFEIPFVTPQGTAMAQFEIARDGGGAEHHEAAERVWRARFSLSIEPAGPVHALITYGGETTNVKMWAERAATAAQIRARVGALNASLSQADLNAGDIVVADGAPAQAQMPAAGHFLNRAT